jgi:hypothetical protein
MLQTNESQFDKGTSVFNICINATLSLVVNSYTVKYLETSMCSSPQPVVFADRVDFEISRLSILAVFAC